MAAAAGAAALLAWLHSAGTGLAFVDGPPVGVTGGFGEHSCRQCHFDNDLNAPGGSIAITGLPESFAPGERYPLTVTLTREQLDAGGFQLAARFAGGERDGLQAGDLAPADERSNVLRDGRRAILYAQHTRAGTKPTAGGKAEWRVTWTAPQTAGKVVLNVAAVAADGDLSSFGDHVYIRELTTTSGHGRPRDGSSPSNSTEGADPRAAANERHSAPSSPSRFRVPGNLLPRDGPSLR